MLAECTSILHKMQGNEKKRGELMQQTQTHVAYSQQKLFWFTN